MKFARLLCSSKSPTTSPPKWRIPEKERRTNINFQLPKFNPIKLLWKVFDASYATYFRIIGSITVIGVLGISMQYFYAQYKFRTSDFAKTAIKALEKYPQLTDILGPPLKGGQVYPYVRNGIQDDEVRVRTPITGKKSSGVLYYHAVKDHDVWIIRGMRFLFTDRAGGMVRLIKDVDENE